MALTSSGFIPQGNLNSDSSALGKAGRKGTVAKVLKALRKYRFLIVLSLVLATVSVIFTLLVPKEIGKAVDSIVSSGDEDLFIHLLKAGIFALIVGVSTYLMNLINNRISFLTVRDIRNEAISKLQTLPLKYIDSHPSGDIVSRIIADIDQFSDGLLLGFSQAFTGVMTILGTLYFMLSMNIAVSLVVICVTPLSLFVAKFISSRTYSMFKLQSAERGEQTALIDEMIGNEKVVKAYGKEADAVEKFDEINERLRKSSLRAIFFSSLTNPCTRFVNAVCYALVALTGSLFIIGGFESGIGAGITVGTLTVFLSYANQYTKPFNEISSVISELQNAIACAARVFEIMEEESESSDEMMGELAEAGGTIELKNVNFSYVEDKELIKNLNVDVKPGMKVAIVGPTGCGKTTIINLLMRFYDVNSGEILVDGQNIAELKRKSLRSNYGMVLQETWLRSGTIKENLLLAKEDATDEEIINAAKMSHAHSFIRRLPNGYDTVIGEGGGSLSQGQKQLLCIARVMLALPPMLILDEATSSIDTRTEIRIQKAFNTMMEGRTSFIVAHRLSTIMNADLILVMKDGQVIEQGNHESLLAAKGFYYELYNSQFTKI
ncbi:MAG: ABC transporter ATP-binding protein/permease [Lachnospiraceae bacterium]|nr:ABC transporter ATP-binding protein/permease [Lachnospiraceae bacterium]